MQPSTQTRLVRPIPWLHTLALLAVILQPSQPATFLGRYSTNALVVLVGLAVTLPVVIRGVNWLSRRTLPSLPTPFLSAGLFLCVVGAAVAGWLTALPTPSYVVLFLYVLYIVVVVALAIIRLMDGASGRGMLRSYVIHAGVLLLLGAVVVAQVFMAARFPGQLWTDEGYNTALSLSIARSGEIAVPFFRLVPELYGPNYSLTYFLTGAALNTFGVELAVARWVIYGIGLAAVALTGYVAARLYSIVVGACVVLIAAVLLLSNNFFRADVEVAFWLAVALWVLWREAQTGHVLWALLAGWAVGFSLDGHPTAYRFIIVLLAYEAISWLILCVRAHRLVLKHRVFAMGIGALLGACSYVLLYSALAPDAFGRRIGEASIGMGLDNLLTLLQAQVISALGNWTLLLGMVGLGVVVALRGGGHWEQRLVFVALGSMFVFGLTYDYYRDYYAVHLLPVYMLLAAVALNALRVVDLREAKRALRETLVLAAVTLLLGIAVLSWQARRVIADAGQDYSVVRAVADQMRPLVPQDAVFLGVDPLYLRMSDYPNFVEFNTGLALALYRGMSETEAWESIAPEVVAIFQDYPIPPPQSLLDYVRDEGFARVACWEGANIGRVDLYLRVMPEGQIAATVCTTVP